MGISIEHSIERVIAAMHENLGEEITIDDMAQIAMFSKFHFSRAFRDSTGLSPARFLSALRLQAAKHLLVSTSLSVADISNEVGYSSIGTFSWRFKCSVGVAPTVFRASVGRNLGNRDGGGRRSPSAGTATVRGRVSAPATHRDSPIFVGLFPGVVPQGSPVRCAFLRTASFYVLDHVPSGTWYVLAYSAPQALVAHEDDLPRPFENAIIGTCGPLLVRSGATLSAADVHLREARSTDPPVLVALPGEKPFRAEADADLAAKYGTRSSA